VDVVRLLERSADAADAAVHHVRRRHDVDAHLGLRQCLAHERIERHVVDDIARLVDYAVLSVRGVRIERNVGHDAELGEALLERRHGARHQPLGIERFAAVFGLQLWIDRGEECQHRDTQF
jgi:hypothetical protein